MKVSHVTGSATIMYSDDDITNNYTYLTHNNYDRPYRIIIEDTKIIIIDENKNKEIMSVIPIEIWIGESPLSKMTEFSGGYGDKFKGNSILLYIDDYYLFIGHQIFSFKTEHKIINYVSEVGNNDVPYPYAIDSENNYYLMIEKIKLPIPDEYNTIPYEYYYSDKNNEDIINVNKFIAEYDDDKIQEYNVSYINNPAEHYYEPWMKNLKAVNKITKEIYSVTLNNYIYMMKQISDKYKYENMNCTIIHPN